MPTAIAVRAAGASDPGLQRAENEDLFHVDVNRGLFIVIDGIGGQAAGGQAARVALSMLRARLERETGPADERVREAITVANNEIHRLAQTRPEWKGMACVLTVALVKDGQATIGHVGDTRLYKIRADVIEKITRDHSPVGEREDRGELSEAAAMQHPRRNEVYRDAGSEPHLPGDPEFVELDVIPFEDDAALLLCSDGLSDLVRSSDMAQIAMRFAGDPDRVVGALIEAANDAGGKDNVTAVFVAGERFAQGVSGRAAEPAVRRLVDGQTPTSGGNRGPIAADRRRFGVRLAIVVLLIALTGAAVVGPRAIPWISDALARGPASSALDSAVGDQVVQPGESIAAAVLRANPGTAVYVEPAEFREQVTMREGVRIVSRVPRGATIRLPATATETDAAVIASGLASGELSGFRIVGDAATPLGTGIQVHAAAVLITDVEIAGATKAAIEFSGPGGALLASEVHDNPGAAMVVHAGGTPRIAHNTFTKNGLAQLAGPPFAIERGGRPVFQWNTFSGLGSEVFNALDTDARLALSQQNWFVRAPLPPPPRLTTPAARGAMSLAPTPPARGSRPRSSR